MTQYQVSASGPLVIHSLSSQGSRRLEKYLNLEGFLEKSN